MYKILKLIKAKFSAYTNPGFGAVQPALKRLEKQGFISSRKSLSDGGKQFVFYEITKSGKAATNILILKDISSNPVQFFSNVRIKLSCAAFLSHDERKSLFTNIKLLALDHKLSAENISEDAYTALSFYQRVVLDNAICEYKNLIMLIEGLEKENECNSK